jgi:glycosyltransferase involved in cell wall biosynthesis
MDCRHPDRFEGESSGSGTEKGKRRSKDMNRCHIVFAIGSLDIGGTEKQMLMLLRSLKERNFLCHLFILESKGPLAKHVTDLGIPIYSCRLRKGDLSRAPWKLLSAQWTLIRMIRKVKPRIVHAYLPLVSFMAALAGKIMHVPLVVTSRRSLGIYQERFPILHPLDIAANMLSHRVTVNSKAVWNDTLNRDHIDPSKLVLIYNSVDPAPFESAFSHRVKIRQDLGIEHHEKVIIVIANLIPYKGHSDLFKSIKLVINQIPEIRLLIVGEDKGIQRQLERQAQEFDIFKIVRFMGQRQDIPYLLAASDLSVLASHEEGFSNAILESMAAGLPVVATRAGGNAEAIVDGVTGWLVPPRNPEEMAGKIIDLLSDFAKARRWGERGRKRIKEKFSTERMVKAYMALYGTG